MKFLPKIGKITFIFINNFLWFFKPELSTKFATKYFSKKGMQIVGIPNYLSSKIWFDGTDYALIELNEGCTISSNVRILTHDWSITTVARALNINVDKPIGIFKKVIIGKYAFIGTGSILMPGCEIGEGAIVGAGTVVRGKVEPYTIVIGNPMIKIGDSKKYTYDMIAKI